MYVLTGPTAGKPPGTGAVQKYWNRGLPLIASGHCVSFLPVSVPRGRSVLGLRIVVQDVAASLGLAVAAAAVRLEFDVAASLWPDVAAAANSAKDVAASLPPTVAAAANPASTTLRRERAEASVEEFRGEFHLAACTDEIQIVSMLSVPPLVMRPRDAQKSADKVHRAFTSGCCDHLARFSGKV